MQTDNRRSIRALVGCRQTLQIVVEMPELKHRTGDRINPNPNKKRIADDGTESIRLKNFDFVALPRQSRILTKKSRQFPDGARAQIGFRHLYIGWCLVSSCCHRFRPRDKFRNKRMGGRIRKLLTLNYYSTHHS